MGYCYRINTDVILANLFGHTQYPCKYSYEQIKDYFHFLSEKFPTYI